MKRKILIADDSEGFRMILRDDLVGWGFDVLEASDGRQAWEMIEAEGGAFDLLITDINMPVMSGIELLQKVGGSEYRGRFAMFALTTEFSMELKKIGKDQGVKAWIGKPYSKDLMQQALKSVFPSGSSL